jgi:hypothetical protein
VLAEVLIDLMVEIEALRGAITDLGGDSALRDSYRRSYRRAALLSHNGAGPMPGSDKVIAQFYPLGGGAWRELLVLERLDYTETETEQFQEEARFVAQLS